VKFSDLSEDQIAESRKYLNAGIRIASGMQAPAVETMKDFMVRANAALSCYANELEKRAMAITFGELLIAYNENTKPQKEIKKETEH
jgi:hypothetical protein